MMRIMISKLMISLGRRSFFCFDISSEFGEQCSTVSNIDFELRDYLVLRQLIGIILCYARVAYSKVSLGLNWRLS